MRRNERRAWAPGLATLALAAVAVALVALFAAMSPDAPPGDDDGAKRWSLDARFSSEYMGSGRLRIAEDGTATVALGLSPSVLTETTLRLTDAERAEIRRALDASGFFGEWQRSRSATDQTMWDVHLRSGGRDRQRRVYDQPEFATAERALVRVILQARLEIELFAAGEFRLAELEATNGVTESRLLRPESLVPTLRRFARTTPDGAAAGRALELVVPIVPLEDWRAALTETLAAAPDAPARRRAVIARIAEPRRRRLLPDAVRAAVATAAADELDRSWRGWGDLAPPDQQALALCAETAAWEHVTRSAATFERMLADLSTDAQPLDLPQFALLGDAAVGPLARLLDDPRVGVRIAAARVCVRLAEVLDGRPERLYLPEIAAAAAFPPVRDVLVPRLSAFADDDAADARLRAAAARALEALGLLATEKELADRAARAASQESVAQTSSGPDPERLARESRRRVEEQVRSAAHVAKLAEPPRAPGPLAISGRVTGPGDVPLPGLEVVAWPRGDEAAAPARRGGWAVVASDGTYTIDGLDAGEYRVEAMPPGDLDHRLAGGTYDPGVVGVQAGSKAVSVTFSRGVVLRGRVVDASGAPLALWRVMATGRAATSPVPQTRPSSGWTYTTADGSFWFLEMEPRVYDLAVEGTHAVEGGDGVAAGAGELTLRASVGRTVLGTVWDEYGAPLPGVSLYPFTRGRSDELPCARSDALGRFRVDGLSAARAYDLVAEWVPGERAQAARTVVTLPLGECGEQRVVVTTGPRVVGSIGRGWARIERNGPVRLVHEATGRVETFPGPGFLVRAAAAGTWRVEVPVRRMRDDGHVASEWIAAATISAGAPETVVDVPR